MKRGRAPDLQPREPSGRYDAGNFSTLCVCGHTLGVHTAAHPRECIAGDFVAGESCGCRRFRKARTK